MDDAVKVPLYIRVIRRETERAFQVILDGNGPFHWLPKAHVADAEALAAGARDTTLFVSAWLAAEVRKRSAAGGDGER
jgi:hypothetical protein